MQIVAFVQMLFDPRGRCNRAGLVVAAVALLAVQLVGGLVLWSASFALTHPLTIAFKALVVYQTFVATTLRLHDIGYSAWRILGFAIGVIGWSLVIVIVAASFYTMDDLQIGQRGFLVVFAAVCVPMAGALLWLHFMPGEQQANRYGPVPGGIGFSRHIARNSSGAIGVGTNAGAAV